MRLAITLNQPHEKCTLGFTNLERFVMYLDNECGLWLYDVVDDVIIAYVGPSLCKEEILNQLKNDNQVNSVCIQNE